MARKKAQGSSVPEWLVTFADLMSILVCFFVLIISFSIPDDEKMQVVAGSMREAFGMIDITRLAGILEREGLPDRAYIKHVTQDPTELAIDIAAIEHELEQRQGQHTDTTDQDPTRIEQTRQFALAAASIAQAWRQRPEVSAFRDNLIVVQDEEGLAIRILDQTGRPMFPPGSKFPYDATRQALAAIAPVLARLPNPIVITGHTAATLGVPEPAYGPWTLTADRADTVRAILEEHGVPGRQIGAIVGKAAVEPLFLDDPYLEANQRVEITLPYVSPPVPPGLSP